MGFFLRSLLNSNVLEKGWYHQTLFVICLGTEARPRRNRFKSESGNMTSKVNGIFSMHRPEVSVLRRWYLCFAPEICMLEKVGGGGRKKKPHKSDQRVCRVAGRAGQISTGKASRGPRGRS